MVKKEEKVKKGKNSWDKKSKIDASKLKLYIKNEKEKGGKAEELEKEKIGKEEDLESNLDNILSFSEGGMTQRLGSGIFRGEINPVRNLEQDIGSGENIAEAETGKAKKANEKNIGYIESPAREYALMPFADEEENWKRQRRGGDDAGRILTAKRIEFGGRETGPAARTIDVEEFHRKTMQGAEGSENYGDYATYAAERKYQSNLPFEQKEKRRRF